MKKTLLTLFLISNFYFSFAQDRKYNIVGAAKEDTFMKSSLTGYSSTFLLKNSFVYISSAINHNSTSYFEVYYNNKKYFIESKDIHCLTSFENIYSLPDNEKDSIKIHAKSNSSLMYKHDMQKAVTALNANKTAGLTILNWSYHDESEYTDGTSAKIEVYNPTSKTIKYIWFSFVGYNPVGDKVLHKGSSIRTVKAVGPIAPKDIASYNYEYVWFTDLVETAKIQSIKVQYMDGTFKTILNPKSITISGTVYQLLFSSDE